MIVQKSVIEIYIDFLEKTLGNKRGYTQSQRQEILDNFCSRGVSDLERVRDDLRDILISGENIGDFPIEEVEALLANFPQKMTEKKQRKLQSQLKNNLLIIPDHLNKKIFAITEVMAIFKSQYPQIVNFEDFGWALKRLIESIFS